MARSLWIGTISFGLAGGPERMFSATGSKRPNKGSRSRKRARKAS